MNYYTPRATNTLKIETFVTPQTYDYLTFLSILKGLTISKLARDAIQKYVKEEMEMNKDEIL